MTTASRPLFAMSVLAVAASLALAACGGGGSGGGGAFFALPAPAATPPATVPPATQPPASEPTLPANTTPVANAGADAVGDKGVAVSFDGSASTDADGDTLTYRWTWATLPSGSQAALSDPAAAKPSFTPDVEGTYELSLVVNDGKVNSEPAKVIFNVGTVAFDTIPAVLPPSAPSYGFYAGGYSNVGDLITLAAGTPRAAYAMDVVLVSWACETGTWQMNCVTTPGATFTHPVTVRIRDAAGTVLLERTQVATIPYRPSTDPTCAVATNWRDEGGTCRTGRTARIAFDLHGLKVTLPDSVRYEIAFNTQGFGDAPLGVAGPYDALNVAAINVAPTIGSDPDLNKNYENGVETNSGGYGLMAQIVLGAPLR